MEGTPSCCLTTPSNACPVIMVTHLVLRILWYLTGMITSQPMPTRRYDVVVVRVLSLSSVPWSIRPLTTHDIFIFKVRFLAAPHMVRGDVSPVFSITWLRKISLCPPLAFFPWTRKKHSERGPGAFEGILLNQQ